MTSMDQIHRIRDLYYGQDKSLAEIASIENLDWRTVRKYVDKEDFNEAPPSPKDELHSSKLDPFKPLIDKWLIADKKAPRKQRHTAKRVHRRLKDEAEGYDCSYRLIATYVAEKKRELRLKQKEASSLHHYWKYAFLCIEHIATIITNPSYFGIGVYFRID